MTHSTTPRHTGRAGAALLCLLASTALAPLTLLPLQAHAGPLAFDAALQQLQQRSDQLAASRNAVESAQLRRDAMQRLGGPVVNPENNPDVVTDQSQVDDLLASLGF